MAEIEELQAGHVTERGLGDALDPVVPREELAQVQQLLQGRRFDGVQLVVGEFPEIGAIKSLVPLIKSSTRATL